MNSILIIENDEFTRHLLTAVLTKQGHETWTASTGEEGLQQFFAHHPQLVLIDTVLSGMDGLETCRRILQLTDVPIILLSSLSGEDDIVRSLDAGAVDFVVKPFSVKVLLARIRVAMRPHKPGVSAQRAVSYSDDHLTVNLDDRRVWTDGQAIKLTATEYNLLAFLVENAGRVCTFRQILENVWGWEYQDSTDYVYTYIRHLRRKLEPDPARPRYFVVEHGVGYRFEKQARQNPLSTSLQHNGTPEEIGLPSSD